MIQNGLAAGTVNKRLKVLRAVLNKAKRDWRVLAEDLPRFDMVREGPQKERYLTDEEVQRLIDASPPHLARRVWTILLEWHCHA